MAPAKKRAPSRRPHIIPVVAGIVRRGSKILISQRLAKDNNGGLWEFPGGKVERGEDDRTALARELREELAITVQVRGLFYELTHAYAEKSVRVRFYFADWLSGQPQKIEVQDWCWIEVGELRQFPFLGANTALIARLEQHYRDLISPRPRLTSPPQTTPTPAPRLTKATPPLGSVPTPRPASQPEIPSSPRQPRRRRAR